MGYPPENANSACARANERDVAIHSKHNDLTSFSAHFAPAAAYEYAKLRERRRQSEQVFRVALAFIRSSSSTRQQQQQQPAAILPSPSSGFSYIGDDGIGCESVSTCGAMKFEI